MSEYRKEVDTEHNTHFTRSQRRASVNVFHKSAVTDHALQNNHNIDWDQAKILCRDSNRHSRWIRESIHIRKQSNSMNRDCGQFHLDHMYNPILRRRPIGVTHNRDVTRCPESSNNSLRKAAELGGRKR